MLGRERVDARRNRYRDPSMRSIGGVEAAASLGGTARQNLAAQALILARRRMWRFFARFAGFHPVARLAASASRALAARARWISIELGTAGGICSGSVTNPFVEIRLMSGCISTTFRSGLI